MVFKNINYNLEAVVKTLNPSNLLVQVKHLQ